MLRRQAAIHLGCRWSVSEPEPDEDAPRMTLSLANAAESRHALQDKTMEALYYRRFLRAKRYKLQVRLPAAGAAYLSSVVLFLFCV